MRVLTARCMLVAAGLGLAALMAYPAATRAQSTSVVYRCTDLFGRVTIQNDQPCPKGSKQDRRVVEVPRAGWHPAPQYYKPEPPKKPDPPDPPDLPALSAGPQPLKPLFRCTRDEEPFLSEDGDPPPVCLQMTTVGIDGSSDMAAGMACEVPDVQCEAVPEAELCAVWGDYVREKLADWKFGSRDNAVEAEAGFEAARQHLRASQCQP